MDAGPARWRKTGMEGTFSADDRGGGNPLTRLRARWRRSPWRIAGTGAVTLAVLALPTVGGATVPRRHTKRGGSIRRITVVVGLVALVAIPAWSLPALAAETTPPTIKAANAVDANADDHVDGFRLTYSEPVNHRRDTDGTYPFTVTGYHINRVLASSDSTTLVIRVRQHSTRDISASPSITYTRTAAQPVTGLSGNQAGDQTFTRTRSLDPDRDGYTVVDGDCNNFNPNIHPGATDVPDLRDGRHADERTGPTVSAR
jgi:hypothetical protein